ncbi:MAG: CoA-binding protein [Clostridia bacterium]|nr:MAG: CoA-binding protein [Clostridia bacterium]
MISKGYDRKAIESLFSPRSMAIVGASPDSFVSRRVIDHLRKYDYRGRIYPVNPKYREVQGLPCYRRVSAIAEDVDTALITVGARNVLSAVADCVEKGVLSVTILSSGFAESGEEGRKRQAELVEYLTDKKIRVLGPNSAGVVNFKDRIPAGPSASAALGIVDGGRIGLVSHSGALGATLINRAQDRGIGFTYFVSPGNQMDLTSEDFIRYMVEDNDTKVIAAYLESVNTRGFVEAVTIARDAGKPVVLFKTGRSQGGKRAAAAHTGAIAGQEEVFDALCRRLAVVRVDDTDELMDLARLLVEDRSPGQGRLAIVSDSGGAAGVFADIAQPLEIPLAEFSGVTKEHLLRTMPSFGTVQNPLDIPGGFEIDPNIYPSCLKAVLNDSGVDILVIPVTVPMGRPAELRSKNIIGVWNETRKPVLVSWMGGSLTGRGAEYIDRAGVPNYPSPGRCIKMVRYLLDYHQMVARFSPLNDSPVAKEMGVAMRDPTLRVYTEHGSKELLARYGIPVSREIVARTTEEAIQAAEELGFPVVLKIHSEAISHKSDVGGVYLGIKDREELRNAYDDMRKRIESAYPGLEPYEVLVQEYLQGGLETIVGLKNDPQFGPVVMFGLGGVFVEVLKDVAMRVVPVTERDAEEMVREIKAHPILAGVRGHPPKDTEAIVDVIMKLSNLGMKMYGQVAEVDINPLMVYGKGQGAVAADALVVEKVRG